MEKQEYEEEVGIHRPSLNLGLGFGVNSQSTIPCAQDPQLESWRGAEWDGTGAGMSPPALQMSPLASPEWRQAPALTDLPSKWLPS